MASYLPKQDWPTGIPPSPSTTDKLKSIACDFCRDDQNCAKVEARCKAYSKDPVKCIQDQIDMCYSQCKIVLDCKVPSIPLQTPLLPLTPAPSPSIPLGPTQQGPLLPLTPTSQSIPLGPTPPSPPTPPDNGPFYPVAPITPMIPLRPSWQKPLDPLTPAPKNPSKNSTRDLIEDLLWILFGFFALYGVWYIAGHYLVRPQSTLPPVVAPGPMI